MLFLAFTPNTGKMKNLKESFARHTKAFQERQADMSVNPLENKKPLSIEDLLIKTRLKLEEKGIKEDQLLSGQEARGIIEELKLPGLDSTRIKDVYSAVRDERAIEFVEGEIKGVRTFFFKRDQVFPFVVICSTPLDRYSYKGKQRVKNWKNVFAKVKQKLACSSEPALADLIILQQKTKKEPVLRPGSQPLATFMPSGLLLDSAATNAQEDLDFPGIKDFSLGRELELFQKSTGESDFYVDGAIRRISSTLGLKHTRDNGGWPKVLIDTAIACGVFKTLSCNGRRRIKSMDDLLLCFALCYINKAKLGKEIIEADDLRNIIDETVDALGEHLLAAKLSDAVKTSELSLERQKTSVEQSQACIKEYKPGGTVLTMAEGWKKEALSAALEKLCNLPFSNGLDGVNSFEMILPSEIAELLTYIFVTMQRRGFDAFRGVFANLNVRGSKEIVKFCLFMVSEEKYKVKNLRIILIPKIILNHRRKKGKKVVVYSKICLSYPR